ncbi:tRNA pseudouridine synthase A [Spirochaetia bacterium]|nr:tRNA pseudouridine synthase A [Spirochaetia bacterium]
MRNIKIIVSYDGTNFCGWQRQPQKRTVQGEIEKALERLHAGFLSTPGIQSEQLTLTAAGRTDAGVHAIGQCANFFTNIENMPGDRFMPAINSMIPHDIRITSSAEVPLHFSSRFDASSRRYRYFFICSEKMLPHERLYALHLQRVPDINLLNDYARLLKGELDCSLFASKRDLIFTRGSGSKSRFIKHAYFFYEGDKLVFEISANAFFWKMVRSIIGTLLFYESRKTPPPVFEQILKEGNRKNVGTTVPPTGLFLWDVEYDADKTAYSVFKYH